MAWFCRLNPACGEHEYQKKVEENEKKYTEMLQKKKVLTRLHRSFGKVGQVFA